MPLRIQADLDPDNQDWIRRLHEPDRRQPIAWYLDKAGNRRPIYGRDDRR